MKCEIRQPCKSCPYRRDVRLGFWQGIEFKDLLAHDSNQFGNMFGCHEGNKKPVEDRDFCAGWVLDQKRRGIPNLQFRLAVIQDSKVGTMLNEITDGGHELYDSIREMAEANFEAEARLLRERAKAAGKSKKTRTPRKGSKT